MQLIWLATWKKKKKKNKELFNISLCLHCQGDTAFNQYVIWQKIRGFVAFSNN